VGCVALDEAMPRGGERRTLALWDALVVLAAGVLLVATLRWLAAASPL
jgi:hypothetical protein